MLNKTLDVIEKYVTAIIFAAMCTVIMLQIILRATGAPLAWSEEIARYLFVWIIYLAAGRAMAKGKHLTVDILPIFLKKKPALILHIFSTILTMVFFAGLLYAGSLVLPNLLVKTQFSPANHINMIIPYAAPTVGTILMAIRGVQIIIDDIKELKEGNFEEKEFGEVTLDE